MSAASKSAWQRKNRIKHNANCRQKRLEKKRKLILDRLWQLHLIRADGVTIHG